MKLVFIGGTENMGKVVADTLKLVAEKIEKGEIAPTAFNMEYVYPQYFAEMIPGPVPTGVRYELEFFFVEKESGTEAPDSPPTTLPRP